MATKKLNLDEFRAELMVNPSLFAHDIDLQRNATLFIRLSEEDYRAASFLDSRVLKDGVVGAWIRQIRVSETIEAHPPTAGPDPHYIFHTGHVGSTLLSRLLDGIPGVLGIREPLVLRSLAHASDHAEESGDPELKAQLRLRISEQTKLWRRSFSRDGVSIVKVTSSAARIGGYLLNTLPGSRAVCLNVSLEVFLATLLAGENSPLDLSGHGLERTRRLFTLLGYHPPQQTLGLGEQAALAWVTESLTQRILSRQFGDRVLFVDFDRFLARLSETLQAISHHLHLNPSDSYFEQAHSNPILFRYAKAPAADYSPAMRSAQLAHARAAHGDEIRRGLAWAQLLARQRPEVGEILDHPM